VTDINVGLSTQEQSDLSKAGVWAYAVYFTGSGAVAHWTTLVNDGTVLSGGTSVLTMPTNFPSGKVYFIVQSETAGSPSLTSEITSESALNWQSATTYDFRYDSFEVTLQNGADDKGNLTSVNGFGLPMEVSVPYQNETTATITSSVGYAVSGATITSDIGDIKGTGTTDTTTNYTYSTGPLQGQFRMAVSPAIATENNSPVTDSPFNTADWNQYIISLEGTQAEDVILNGWFNGAKDAGSIWHNSGFFAYQLEWDSTNQVFWLAPLASSEIKGYIKITPADLANSIYATIGTVEIYASTTDATPYLTMNTGANNQWGKVLSQLLVGFTGGYYGETGNSLNTLNPSGTVDLNKDFNWDPTYAFHSNLASTPPTTYQTDDPYAEIFFKDSNSYGSGYSDALMSGYSTGGPLISVSQPTSLNSATYENVPTINLTIFSDTETPSGYTTPKIDNYIAPGTSSYEAVSASSANNVVLNLAAADGDNSGVILSPQGSVTLSFETADSNGTLGWATVTLNGAIAGPNGLWQGWDIVATGSTSPTSSIVYGVVANGVSQSVGALVINDFPVAQDGIAWYKIGVAGKTFDVYATTKGGSFENPNYTGQQGALAVDGLATVTPGQTTSDTVSTFTVAFANGDTVAFDPSQEVRNTDTLRIAGLTQPTAPVAGTLAQGNTTLDALPGQTVDINPSITTTTTDLAFAWSGANTAYASSWISGYTNKIDANTVARVTLAPAGGGTTLYATATADLDGQWQTGTVSLNPGATYIVTEQEYAASDTSFANALTPVSSALTLDIACFASGTRIATTRGEVPVQHLRVGDTALLATGGTAPIVWLGHRRVAVRRHTRPFDVQPVRVAAGAFGEGRPARDLRLSPDHAVFVDGVLVPIRHLINDTTIRQAAVASVTYWHVELAAHGVLLAEGLPAESYLDTGNRAAFANGGAVVQMQPDFALGVWDAQACARLVRDGAELVALRRAVLERAAELGHRSTDDPRLRLLVDGRPVAAQRRGDWHVARLPVGAQALRLTSRCWTPAHVLPDAKDRRCLGVGVLRLVVDGHAVSLDSPNLRSGWHEPEPDGRWTTGDATLTVTGAREIALLVARAGTYWESQDAAAGVTSAATPPRRSSAWRAGDRARRARSG
jgi:hypothetical protein